MAQEEADAGPDAGMHPAGVLPEIEGKTDVYMSDLRRLATAARETRPKRRVDPNSLPFGIEIEMEGVRSFEQTRASVGRLPMWWHDFRPRRWHVDRDESLSATGAEAVSPPMRMKNGQGADAIRQAYRVMRENGGTATRRCGLHVHVDARALGENGLAILMQMALENEALLFRIAQNGHPTHRGDLENSRDNSEYKGIPHYFARPLTTTFSEPFSLVHAADNNEFRNAYYEAIPEEPGKLRPHLPPPTSSAPFKPDRRDPARYFDVNFSSYWSRGTIEFRLFDGVDDPEQAIANVRLALGMVAAAANGDYTWLKSNPLGTNVADVPREQFNHFMEKVAPDPALRQHLERTFLAGGGRIVDDQPIRDPEVLQLARLMNAGRRLEASGKPIWSPFEAQALMNSPAHRVYVVEAENPTSV